MYLPTLLSSAAILQENTTTQSASPDPGPDGGGADPNQTPAGPCGGGTNMMLPMVAILAIFWIVMIGPERKKRKKREAMLGALQKGDKVMTNGGMYGSVASVQDDIVTVQVADNVRIKFSRGAIQTVLERKDGNQPADGESKG